MGSDELAHHALGERTDAAERSFVSGLVLGGCYLPVDLLSGDAPLDLLISRTLELLGEQLCVHLLPVGEEIIREPVVIGRPSRGICRHEGDIAGDRCSPKTQRRLSNPMPDATKTLGRFVGSFGVHAELRLDRLGGTIHELSVRRHRSAHLVFRRM